MTRADVGKPPGALSTPGVSSEYPRAVGEPLVLLEYQPPFKPQLVPEPRVASATMFPLSAQEVTFEDAHEFENTYDFVY